ncbi:MAG: UvrD-helicase domain-containing protein [Opitutales bacterium]|nr:UvrD-helicase domain-containing protein [Opitutales bacterium]
MSLQLENEMILASAGSGKTYQLTLRFIRLLVAGAEPGEIAALTFTRKAAGEFLEAILKRLAKASFDEQERGRLCKELKRTELSAETVQAVLAKVIAGLHRLRLGTLDSFFNGFIQAYGLELGLPGSVDIVDGFQLKQLRRQIWSRMFHQATGAERRELMQICNENAWGDAHKQVSSALNEFIDNNHHRYVRNPAPTSWSDPYTAAGQHSPWPGKLDDNFAQRVEDLAARIDAMDWKPKVRQNWTEFFDSARNWQWCQAPPDSKAYILARLLERYQQLPEGTAVLKFYRDEIPVDPALGAELKWLIDQFVGSVWQRARRHTQLTHRLLERYEKAYQERVRSQGRLTFSDMPILLLGLFSDNDPAWAFYRMDGRIQHWMLDEFQDTSREQWAALEPLISEVLQDPSNSRSLFYVGDVKQSIYGWRGGDPLLFKAIEESYPGRIESRRLAVSFRSNWPVLRLVNAVCGNHDFLAEHFPMPAVERWKQDWEDHEPDAKLSEVTGECRVITCAERSLEAKTVHAIDLIQQIQPIERGLSCAILTLKNDETDAIVRQLRQAGIDCAREGEAEIASDNMPGRLLRALFQVIAHPEDRLSLGMIEMSPIRWPGNAKTTGALQFIAHLHRETHRNGYAAATTEVLASIQASIKVDAFNQRRCQQLLDAARDYDALDLRSEAGFVDFLTSATVRESSDAGRIEIMTIHKSKGLGFDMVILPQLQRNKLDDLGAIQFLHSPDTESSWVFKQPPSDFAELDPRILSARNQLAERECFERFCQIYVALTRAKRALYLILNPTPKSSSSGNFENWIRDSLPPSASDEGNSLYRDGDHKWFEQIPKPQQRLQPPAPPKPTVYPTSPSIVAEIPSAVSRDRKLRVADWFRTDEQAAEKGTRLHNSLAQVEWLDPREAAPFPELESISIRQLLEPQPCELWREQAFDLRIDGRWISGIFDRVHLFRSPQGTYTHAVLIDFKTETIQADTLSSRSETYRPQLQRYRQALSAITGINPDKIKALLAFLHNGQVIELK